MLAFEFIAAWAVFSAVAGIVANAKGRSGIGFFLLSVVASPLVGILLAALLPRKVSTLLIPGPGDNTEGARMPCPVCAESIASAAKVCRFCGHGITSRTGFTTTGDPPTADQGLNNKLAAAAASLLARSDKSHRFPPQ